MVGEVGEAITGQTERKVQVGDIVLYVLGDGQNKGEVRPALVVRTWSEKCVQLQVFIDDSNDYPEARSPLWKTSRMYDENKTPNTWHFKGE